MSADLILGGAAVLGLTGLILWAYFHGRGTARDKAKAEVLKTSNEQQEARIDALEDNASRDRDALLSKLSKHEDSD